MARTQAAVATSAPAPSTRWLLISALIGLGFAAASTWVHYRILRDPLYSSICDVNATFSCTEAYTSRFGSVAGVPVALIGVLYFSFVLGLLALCGRSTAARQNAAGYVFALSTLGLAGVLYLGYASFFILQTVCLLCVAVYAAIIALFVISGQAARYPMSTLPGRASRDFRLLLRTPAALTAALAFVGLAAVAITVFPAEPISASSDVPAPSAIQAAPAQPPVAVPDALLKQLDDYLSKQPRIPIVVGASGASVVIIKFNDYQCPPCGQTFREYKPVLARLQQKYPGKIAFITRDFPLDPECNPRGGTHQAACEAAVAVRLAREKGRADAMEDWLFANQATLTPERVREGAATIGGVSDFATRYPQTLELVRGEISQGLQLKVGGTPTFFMNGLRLGNWPSEVFEAAVEWELRRLAAASH